MTIAYVVTDYTNSGGMERTMASKANYLVNLGLEVYIISNPPASPEPFFFHDPRIKIIHLKSTRHKKCRENYLKELYNVLSSIKPDISLSTGLDNSRYLYKVKDESKKILEIHFPKYNRKHWLTKLDKYAFGRFISDWYTSEKIKTAKEYDRFIVLTEEDKEYWRGFNNIEVISNPLFSVPTEYASCYSKSAITVGRFTYQKGYEYLIDVWKFVAEKHPDWKLMVYGSGRKRQDVQKQIEKYGLGDVIILNDPVKDIFKVILESSIYVMTSRYEGHPLTLLETMACGVPPVSFACKCGPRDIITDGEDGFLVNFGDVKGCAKRICELIESENLRKKMGEVARENILRYSLENMMAKWIKLFEDLTGQELNEDRKLD